MREQLANALKNTLNNFKAWGIERLERRSGLRMVTEAEEIEVKNQTTFENEDVEKFAYTEEEEEEDTKPLKEFITVHSTGHIYEYEIYTDAEQTDGAIRMFDKMDGELILEGSITKIGRDRYEESKSYDNGKVCELSFFKNGKEISKDKYLSQTKTSKSAAAADFLDKNPVNSDLDKVLKKGMAEGHKLQDLALEFIKRQTVGANEEKSQEIVKQVQTVAEEIQKSHQEQSFDAIQYDGNINAEALTIENKKVVTNFRETWKQGFDGQYTTYKYEDCMLVDKGNLIQTNGKNSVIEAKASFALALEKGWDMNNVEVQGNKDFKHAWQDELVKYNQGVKEIQADKFQEAAKIAEKGLKYGLENQDILKEGEKLGYNKDTMQDAVTLESLRRTKELEISDKDMQTMTHEKAKEHIENAKTQNAENIKDSVNEREKNVVQGGGGHER